MYGDNEDIFKENILDIIDNWNGYPRQNPCDYSSIAAIQAGIVELRCFINNTCPFSASPKKEDILVFNENTMKTVIPNLPKSSQVITCTPGTEGIHFIPRYVFRHNYIYKKRADAPPETYNGSKEDDRYLYGFESYYEPIEANAVQTASTTRYMAEQSWVEEDAVFESGSTITTEECRDAKWMYQPMTIKESQNSHDDILYDYVKSASMAHYSAVSSADLAIKEAQAAGKEVPPLSADQMGIPLKLVQVPVQYNVQPTNGLPIHWRIVKRTPLFKGEDFFIRFYKKAKSVSASTTAPPTPSFKDHNYDILDVTCQGRATRTFQGTEKNLTRKINYGVTPSEVSANPENEGMSFDLYQQAYYLVELGKGTAFNNYFILISEKNPPVFLMRQPFGDSSISRVLSTYDKIKGSQLIDSDHFTMTVRNHLGKIIIVFETGGSSLEPWVINKTEWYPYQDSMTREPMIGEKATILTVPRGRMSIWGGNIRCGFIFGPLQYHSGQVAFCYPPRQLVEGKDDGLYKVIDVMAGTPENLTKQGYRATFDVNPCFLPSAGNHHLLFTSSDIYLNELGKTVYIPNSSFTKYHLFTQDAEYYVQYDEENGRPTGYRKMPGYYFYGPPLRECSDTSSVSTRIKPSLITTRKNKYINDTSTRHQAFDVLLGMVCGDHVFTMSTWSYLDEFNKKMPSSLDWSLSNPKSSNYSDYEWFIPSCKTPILTHLRLVADESSSPRWDDGTSVASGVAKTPLHETSPYFIEATHHVMNYSETWSANSWSEIEHSGTINFYLNRDIDPIENQVTDYLLNLQNKNFYVEIWAGYRNCSYPGFLGLYKLFTGICQGGSISYEYNKNILSCKIVDYSVVLKGEKFFNSPWYDGMKDINAVWEILQLAGFRSTGKYDPGSVVRSLSQMASRGNSSTFFHHWDGRPFKMETYALPSGYERLEQPSFKFNDGEPLYDAIVKIATKAAKVFYFDQFGIARYEDLQDVIEKDYLGQVPLTPLFQFTTNPIIWGGQLVFNKVERSYDMTTTNNHIKVMSTTPDMHLLIRDQLNWQSMEDPTTEGFLGYKKTFYQQEGIFGSKAAVYNAVTKYKVMWRPKVTVTFETYGVPMRANDIISINGEITRVISVSHQIDAQKNEWWMQVECMRYQTVQNAKMYTDTSVPT